ncbi:MAG: hypothetical protein ACLPXM_18460 [Terriglobales bacterium]
MSKQTRWLPICAGVVVALGGALLWQHFHQQIISTLGGGVASIAPIRGGQNTAASSAAASPGSPAESPVASPAQTTPPQAVRFHSATGRVVSCSNSVLVIAQAEGGHVRFKIDLDSKAECLRDIGRVVRVEYTQTDTRKVVNRIVSRAEEQQKAGSR